MPKRDVRPSELANLTTVERARVQREVGLWMAINRARRRPALEERKREQGERERVAVAQRRALQGL